MMKMAREIADAVKRDPGMFGNLFSAVKKAAASYGPKIIEGVVSGLTQQ